METFVEFVDKKEREAKQHLKIVKKLLESQGMKVSDHLKADDPYLFLFNPTENNVSFEGIRIYKIGSTLAFRIQKEEETHPFGRAYPLDIEEMFNDLLVDHHKPEEAGKRVIKAVRDEMVEFFKKTSEAEKDLRNFEFDPNDPFSRVAVRSNNMDYSNTMYMSRN